MFSCIKNLARKLWAFVLSRIWYEYQGLSVKPPRTFEGRQQWSKKMDFLMACTGYAVGLGNVWRFPYLCYKNGGGAFLIPYFVVTLTSGVPLFFLEIALGQYTGQGCVTCWKLCPAFKGIGYGIVVLCTWLNVYYIVVLAWSLFYFGMSFREILPWSTCGNDWNTDFCTTGGVLSKNISNCSYVQNMANFNASIGFNMTDNPNCSITVKLNDSAEEFWRNYVLDMSDGIEQIGGLNYGMVLSLAIAWLMNYFIIWKGVKVSGKIVYFTALFPYAMLFILLIRGVTLQGAGLGIEFYLKPNFSKVFEAQVWMDAGTQIFFAYAVSTGALIAMGSYNRFTNNCYMDTWIICLINSGTSILAGFCIFSVLGYMADQLHVPVDEVVKDGPGLAFIAYPKALSQMPGYTQMWAVMFFLMLIFLGIDSEFVGLEGLFTTLLDMYPKVRLGYRPEITMFLACFASFIFGLSMCTRPLKHVLAPCISPLVLFFRSISKGFNYLQLVLYSITFLTICMPFKGGIYVFQLFDYYSASGFVLLWFCFFECLVVGWIYGARRFYKDLTTMMGYKISSWMLFCWTILAPITSIIIFTVSIAQYTPIKLDNYQYPAWGDALGLFLSISSMVCIPVYFVYRFFVAKGSTLTQKFTDMFTPEYKDLISPIELAPPILTNDRRVSAKDHEIWVKTNLMDGDNSSMYQSEL